MSIAVDVVFVNASHWPISISPLPLVVSVDLVKCVCVCGRLFSVIGGAVLRITTDFCATLLEVVSRHTVAHRNAHGRFGGEFYSEILQTADIESLLFAVGPILALVRLVTSVVIMQKAKCKVV